MSSPRDVDPGLHVLALQTLRELDAIRLWHAGYWLYRAALNNTPWCQELAVRMFHPMLGDLVIEVSHRVAEQHPRAVGHLLRFDVDERIDDDGERWSEPVVWIKTLSGEERMWEDCRFVAIPDGESTGWPE